MARKILTPERIIGMLREFEVRLAQGEFNKGISLGCPLSPLIGAFILSALDIPR